MKVGRLEKVHSHGGSNANDDDLKESIRACLLRTESGLIERHIPHVAELQEKFPALDFNAPIVQVGSENIDLHIQSPAVSRKTNVSQSGLDDESIFQLYEEYLLISIRTLEAFTPKNHESPVLSLFHDALSKGLQVEFFLSPPLHIYILKMTKC